MKKIYSSLIKILLCTIIFLSLAILSKKNNTYKEKINYELYENHLSFTKFKEVYDRYLGGIFPLENIKTEKNKLVFDEKIKYTNITPYQKGAILEVQSQYLVPNQEAGVVVYVGEKEEYGNTVIIEGLNNIDTWYGNICTANVKLYDYIEKGKYIGETCDNKLYLVYSKNNKYLNYEDYLL